MNKLFRTSYNEGQFQWVLLFVRISIGAFMLVHGLPKLGNFFADGPVAFADPFGFGPVISLLFTVFSEVVCSVFIILGLGTRLAVIPLIITMGTAVFVIHAGDGFGKQELAAHYLLTYILLLVTGSGKYSVDQLLGKNNNLKI